VGQWEIGLVMSKEIKAGIKFDGDSKRFHRYKVIDPEGDIVGTIYLSKQMNPLPKRVVFEVKS
jgi:hypothetical protein